MKNQIWNFFGVIGALVTGFAAIVGGNALANKLLGHKMPRVDNQRIHDHLKVGAFIADGDFGGPNPDGLPGRLEFPTLYLTVHINEDKSVRRKQDGHDWEPIEGRLREDILFAYNQKVWG
jgi:hypothetical protein